MKIATTAACLLFLLLPGMPCLGQEQPPAPNTRRVSEAPPQVLRRQPVPSSRPMPVRSQPPGQLSENHTISLEGTIAPGQAVELALTGIGPEFMTDHSLEDGTTLSCQYQVTEAEDALILDYTIGMRIRVAKKDKVAVSQSGAQGIVASRVEFRDEMTRGRVRCRLDEPVAILKGKNHALSLTISKPDPAKHDKKR